MTKITFYTKSNKYIGFKSEGHAGYEERGKDIVCSAILLIITSPIMLITLKFSPFKSRARAIPSAAEIAVEECPVLKQSYSLSVVLGNPESPPNERRDGKYNRLPVISL